MEIPLEVKRQFARSRYSKETCERHENDTTWYDAVWNKNWIDDSEYGYSEKMYRWCKEYVGESWAIQHRADDPALRKAVGNRQSVEEWYHHSRGEATRAEKNRVIKLIKGLYEKGAKKYETAQSVMSLVNEANKISCCKIDDSDTLLTYGHDTGYYTVQPGKLVDNYQRLVIGMVYGDTTLSMIDDTLGEKIVKTAKKSKCRILREQCDTHGMICAANCMIDIRVDEDTGMVKPHMISHSPEYLCVAHIPISYDPELADESKLPTYVRFLEEMSKDHNGIIRPTIIERLWEVKALCIYPMPDLQCAHMLFGIGDNSKGSFTEEIKGELGDKNSSNITVALMTAPNINGADVWYPQLGKLANFDDDMTGSSLSEISRIKSILGGSSQTIPQKYKSTIETPILCTQVWSLNNIPKFARDRGILRKLNVIHLQHTIPKEDRIRGYHNILLSEKEAIFAMTVSKVCGLVARGDLKYRQSVEEIINILADNTEDMVEQCIHNLFKPIPESDKHLSMKAADIMSVVHASLISEYGYSEYDAEKVTIRQVVKYAPVRGSQTKYRGNRTYLVSTKDNTGGEPYQTQMT